MTGAVDRVVLDRPRELGDLLALSLRLFARHFSVFYTLALIVVAPYVLVVDGVWGRELADGARASVPAAAWTSWAIGTFLAQPLITAFNARVLVGLGQGRAPAVAVALREGLAVGLPAVVAVAMYVLGVFAGFALLVVPGVYVAVRWYFAAQAAVVDGRRGTAALGRSAEVVTGVWWPTLGRLVAIALLATVVGVVTGGLLGAIGDAAGSPPLYVVGIILGQAAAATVGALGGTLLFFDRRARHAAAPATRVAP